MAIKRTDIINHLIKTNDYKTYLEIGVFLGRNFRKVKAKTKHSVDPRSGAIYKMTSDQFFATNKNTYDIIFVDGLHTYKQVKKDIDNALKVLNAGGVIVIHDCNPTTEALQAIEAPPFGPWSGDGWKAIYDLRKTRGDLTIRTVDTDYGCGIIKLGQSQTLNLSNEEATYELLEKHRNEILNLISVEEFMRLY